jgi:hypothetical protein
MEYLPKGVRVDLTKMAVVFDGQLISMLKPGTTHNDLMGVLSLSREYISRSIAHAAVFDRLVYRFFFSHKNLADPLQGNGCGHEVPP